MSRRFFVDDKTIALLTERGMSASQIAEAYTKLTGITVSQYTVDHRRWKAGVRIPKKPPLVLWRYHWPWVYLPEHRYAFKDTRLRHYPALLGRVRLDYLMAEKRLGYPVNPAIYAVEFIDGDTSNIKPENLRVVPKATPLAKAEAVRRYLNLCDKTKSLACGESVIELVKPFRGSIRRLQRAVARQLLKKVVPRLAPIQFAGGYYVFPDVPDSLSTSKRTILASGSLHGLWNWRTVLEWIFLVENANWLSVDKLTDLISALVGWRYRTPEEGPRRLFVLKARWLKRNRRMDVSPRDLPLGQRVEMRVEPFPHLGPVAVAGLRYGVPHGWTDVLTRKRQRWLPPAPQAKGEFV